MTTLTPVLTKRFGTDQPWKIANYERLDGYAGLRKALTIAPDDLIAMADSIDSIEGGRAKAPPVPLRQDLWPWPAGLALLCAAGLLVARRKA